jgi:hypothetical protein
MSNLTREMSPIPHLWEVRTNHGTIDHQGGGVA